MAGLTKQHFKAIADILHKYKLDNDKDKDLIDAERCTDVYSYIEHIACEIADYFKTQNPLFNRERFLKACLE